MLVSMLVALMIGSGVAMAAVLNGTSGSDRLVGTAFSDIIRGYAGRDYIDGRGSADRLVGGPNADVIIDGPLREQATDFIYAGGGRDRINTNNSPNHRDVIRCGFGFDTVVAADPIDQVRNCERIESVR